MIKTTPLLLLLIAVLYVGPPLASTLAEFEFADPQQEQEFRELSEQLRCLVCQNESLAASQAELAQDLRREVYKMMQTGKSQQEIVGFLVDRYGDFVLYDPPFKPSTYLIWIGPFVLILVAALFLARILLRKNKAREPEISDRERQRLQQLLADGPDRQKAKK